MTPISKPRLVVVTLALAASMFGGVVSAYGAGRDAQQQEQCRPIVARYLAVLKSAQEWEARYRQMYPESR